MTESPHQIIQEIDSLRQDLNLTIQGLAERAGMSDKTLRRRRTRPEKFTLDELIALSRVLHVDLEVLFAPAPADAPTALAA